MAAYLNRLHHISFHVSKVDKIAYDLVYKFQFKLFAARTTDHLRQLAFKKGDAVFVVNERPNQYTSRLNELTTTDYHGRSWNNTCDKVQDYYQKCLYDAAPHYPVDTACNVCFEVKDVERAFDALHNQGCDFLLPPTVVNDERGIVTYSVLRSIVGNVCHTLIDTSKYEGRFLPGFEDIVDNVEMDNTSCAITHFDHITYACPRKFTPQIMQWYERLFGFQRFFIGSNEDIDEGYILKQEGMGLRLTAMQYWKCSKAGIQLPFVDKKEPDCKLVIAESLPEQGVNQVDTFLEQHQGPGIQHIALYTQDIVSAAHTMAEAGVQFFSPPSAYYTEVGKLQEIVKAGHNPKMLAQHGILLDTDLRQDTSLDKSSEENRRYLLQVFTKPIFAEDTFFLELIERRGAAGFGEGNIKALWRSVQVYMENKMGVESPGDGTPKLFAQQ